MRLREANEHARSIAPTWDGAAVAYGRIRWQGCADAIVGDQKFIFGDGFLVGDGIDMPSRGVLHWAQ
ncbi:hypothetical protein [Modicisalibacter luteus]|uniref:hypothetical protein n=1 Tax=Modicisalibacter luteus TaxID=453962 RepID=UPI0036360FBC